MSLPNVLLSRQPSRQTNSPHSSHLLLGHRFESRRRRPIIRHDRDRGQTDLWQDGASSPRYSTFGSRCRSRAPNVFDLEDKKTYSTVHCAGQTNTRSANVMSIRTRKVIERAPPATTGGRTRTDGQSDASFPPRLRENYGQLKCRREHDLPFVCPSSAAGGER